MNITTGVFTVGQGFSGVWTVTYSIIGLGQGVNGKDQNLLNLYLNGDKIGESIHYSANQNPGEVYSMGGRTLHLRLREGDEVSLRSEEVYYLTYITMCFRLAQIDNIP